MKRKLLLAFVLGIPLVLLFLWAREAASWRPQIVGQVSPQHTQFQFSPEGRWVVVSGPLLDTTPYLCDLKSNTIVRDVPSAHFYRFSHDSRQLAAVGQVEQKENRGQWFLAPSPEAASVQDVWSGRKIFSFRETSGSKRFDWIPPSLLDAAFSPNDRQLRILTADTLRAFDVTTGRLERTTVMKWSVVWKGERQKEYARFSPDGRLILHSAPYRRRLLDTETGKLINTFFEGTATLQSPANRIFWSPDSQVVAACNSRNSECDIHEVPKGRMATYFFCDLTMEQRSGSGPITEKWVGFGPDSYSYFLFSPSDSRLNHWNVSAQVPSERRRVSFQWPFAISPDASFAISIDKTGQLLRWRLK